MTQPNATAAFPPTIVSTVSGTGGKNYFVSNDGFLYYAGADGNLVQFGRFTPQGTLSTANMGVNLTPTGGSAVPSSLSPPSVGGSNSVISPTTPIVPSSGSVSAISNGVATTITANPSTSSTLTTNGGSGLSIGGTVAGNNTILTKGSALPLGFRTGVNGTSVTVNGIVRGNDGKTLYTGSDGNLYFRGADGMLHVVGSGASE